MSDRSRRVWAVVPAAGSGERMHSELPKQYLPLSGSRVLDHTLAGLLASSIFERLVVVLAPDDTHWRESALAGNPRVVTATGGDSRSESVSNGLARLEEFADADDRVAIHDAARPCLAQDDLRSVVDAAHHRADGALLAIPVTDTLKSADEHACVAQTLDRSGLWRALTPQVFPLELVRTAMQTALHRGLQLTDEAQAMELAGYRPQLVPGSADNLKITHPDDLRLAEALLAKLATC